MNLSGCFLRVLAWTLGAGIGLCVVGCENIFIAKHKVLVDAIAAPGAVKPSGKSYRLVAKKSVVANVAMQVPVVKACVDAALTGQGMFEAPPNLPPDYFIEVGFGTDTSGRVDPASRETFVQLSARDNPDRSMEKSTGTELWDVRVAVLGIAGRVESAMPLLCAVAANYIATDTHMETKIDIPQNSPMIASVRESAIKSLESKGTPASVVPPPAAPAPEPVKDKTPVNGAPAGAAASAAPITATR